MAAARVKGKDHFPTAVRSWWVPSERLVGDGGSGGTAAVGAAASSTIAWSPIRKAAGQEAAGTAEGRTSREGARVRSGEGGKGGRKWLVGQPSGCSGLMPPTKAKRALRTRSPPSPKSPVPSNFYGLWTWQAYPNRHAERSTSFATCHTPLENRLDHWQGSVRARAPPGTPLPLRAMYVRAPRRRPRRSTRLGGSFYHARLPRRPPSPPSSTRRWPRSPTHESRERNGPRLRPPDAALPPTRSLTPSSVWQPLDLLSPPCPPPPSFP